MLGWHVGGQEALNQYLLSPYKNPVQFFIGSPRTLRHTLIHGCMDTQGVDTVCHGPFVGTLSYPMSEKLYLATLRHTIEVAHFLQSIGCKHYVVHTGGKQAHQTQEDAYKSVLNFCWKWLWETQGTNVILCLENDCGSKTGSKPGDIALVYQAVKKINDPRVRICFDTLHAYSSGFDIGIQDRVDKVLDLTAVCHLNSVPLNVGFKSHLDRHSETAIQDSKPDQIENIVSISNKCVERNIIRILERDKELVPRDLEFLGETLWHK